MSQNKTASTKQSIKTRVLCIVMATLTVLSLAWVAVMLVTDNAGETLAPTVSNDAQTTVSADAQPTVSGEAKPEASNGQTATVKPSAGNETKPTANSTATVKPSTAPTQKPTAKEDITLIAPANNSEVVLQTARQLEFLRIQSTITEQTTTCPFNFATLCAPYPSENSRPLDIELKWDNNGTGTYTYKVYVSRNADFSGAEIYDDIKYESLKITNLYIATKYYWKVEAISGGKVAYTSDVYTFNTADIAPRVINVNSLSNVRDMGGWKTVDGRRIRQGCMYRSVEFNDHYALSDAGADTIINQLGIKVDFDIRGMEMPFFDNDVIRHEEFGIGSYSGIGATLPKATIRRIYNLMLNSVNEPFIMHCWGGADRTGSLVFLMNGLLGVSYEDLCADFEFTGMSVHGERCQFGDNFLGLIKLVRRYGDDGDSINTCIEKMFMRKGITAEEIKTLKDTLLEEVK